MPERRWVRSAILLGTVPALIALTGACSGGEGDRTGKAGNASVSGPGPGAASDGAGNTVAGAPGSSAIPNTGAGNAGADGTTGPGMTAGGSSGNPTPAMPAGQLRARLQRAAGRQGRTQRRAGLLSRRVVRQERIAEGVRVHAVPAVA